MEPRSTGITAPVMKAAASKASSTTMPLRSSGPPEIVNKLNAEIAAILKQPDTRERIARDGADPVGNTPQQFGAFIQSEIEKWRKVIRAAGIEPS